MTTINNLTANNNVTLGTTYKKDKGNGLFVEGQLRENKTGQLVIEFLDGKNNIKSQPLSDKWQLVETVQNPPKGVNLLDKILTDKENKGDAKSKEQASETEQASDKKGKKGKESKEEAMPELLTESEILERKTLEHKFRQLENEFKNAGKKVKDCELKLQDAKNTFLKLESNLPFEQAKICAEISEKKLFRREANGKILYKTFKAYAKEVLKIDDKHALALSAIGKFALVNEDSFKRDDIAVNLAQTAVTQIMRSQNRIADNLQLTDEQATLPSMKGITKAIADIMIEAGKDETGKVSTISKGLTENINEVIETKLKTFETYSGKDILQKVIKSLQDEKLQIISEAKDKVSAEIKAKQDEAKKALSACKHLDKTGKKQAGYSIDDTGLITFECGCKARMLAK